MANVGYLDIEVAIIIDIADGDTTARIRAANPLLTQGALRFGITELDWLNRGGAGNIPGAILGGILISYIPDRLTGISIAGIDAAQYKFMLFGILIVVIMIFRPQGLIPSRRRAAELKDREKEVAPQ